MIEKEINISETCGLCIFHEWYSNNQSYCNYYDRPFEYDHIFPVFGKINAEKPTFCKLKKIVGYESP